MKKLFVVFAILLGASAGNADFVPPTKLTFTQSPGFVMMSWAFNQKCEISTDFIDVEINHAYKNISLSRKSPIQLSNDMLNGLFVGAEAGPILEGESFIVDAPYINYYAHKDSGERVMLKSWGSNPEIINESEAAKKLIFFVDMLCKPIINELMSQGVELAAE